MKKFSLFHWHILAKLQESILIFWKEYFSSDIHLKLPIYLFQINLTKYFAAKYFVHTKQ